ncbi:acyltransferase [Chryseobacterium indoltheticum]|uniref:Galactoside O-acetyltransferase n=1 Tax=Chryseobacterium indoltheticum TaxID=254 RepID=A0A381F594_9FLAO|nr:acyltransferase [Chryseobacterium indoltheticum]AZA75232.1 acyltransferase [Chryseobacterium indoltheticum]SIR15291.1 maltose O-acetyltransferase [Chryseobacterium indoltheticum]SUX41726.1 Galactoside O-acetyltransferase [Chryseobacterium indoltheticum]
MKYRNIEFSLSQLLFLIIYKVFLVWMPSSTCPIVGSVFRKLRFLCCRKIFLQCGKNVNIERGANFGSGFRLRIGDNSGIGINCTVPGNILIGKNVMMGPECYILSTNHSFDRVDVPMIEQGNTVQLDTIIEDDVWIGRQVIFTPGRIVKKGSIIAAGCVLSKNFSEYSIIGGNPSRIIKTRI